NSGVQRDCDAYPPAVVPPRRTTDSGQKTVMNKAAASSEADTLKGRLTSRGELIGFLMNAAVNTGADSYMLVAISHGEARNQARIVASNWKFDVIELIGRQLIATLAQ